MTKRENYDIVIIGGGFFGCCLAAYMKHKGINILLLEKERDLMLRSSAVNQARVHTGFHYPRSFVTALRSLANLPRFMLEFRTAITDNFTMLYAVALKGSKVGANRFYATFKDMNAPIKRANPEHSRLFDKRLIEDVFEVKEYAFDYTVVRDILRRQMENRGVEIVLETRVRRCVKGDRNTRLELDNGKSIFSEHVFNCTYSLLNVLLDESGQSLLPLKHEITEVALVQPPSELNNIGITVIDGPFFSTMPYPARECYSFTHVRYTPHLMWKDVSPCVDGHEYLLKNIPPSNYNHMVRDAVRYTPCLSQTRYIESLFEVKSILLKNEGDDGRPIMLQECSELRSMYSVLGGKIDNVFDLFEYLGQVKNAFKRDKGAFNIGSTP